MGQHDFTRRTILAGLASMLALPTQAAPTDLQTIADDLRSTTGTPGLTMCFGGPDGSGFVHSGTLRRGADLPIGPAHLWHLGSIAKSMTATLIARLVATGDLAFSDRMVDRLPDLAAIDPGYGEVTIRDLLDHRGGVPANADLAIARDLVGTLQTRPNIRADRLLYADNVLSQPPDPTVTYSNAGYVLLGMICETARNAPWESLIQSELFQPLGIQSAGFGSPGLTDPDSQPWGHKPNFLGRLKPVPPGPKADNVPALGPAGRVHMNAADLIRYLGAHAERSPALLPTELWDMLHIPVEDRDYACGWGVSGDIRVHNGSNTFWYAVAAFDMSSRRTAAILTNSGALKRLYQPSQMALLDLLQSR
ncbi:MAG: serine hydrolase [Pseudomonadota bacterium]